MAMIDYGAIAWKNGKLISTDMFEDMNKIVGWTDDGQDLYCGNLHDDYFTYIGDKDLTVAFYKNVMVIYRREFPIYEQDNGKVYFGFERFVKWKYWHDWFFVGKDMCDIKVRKKRGHHYYICKMKYRGHKYKVAFGYGVDLRYYEKTHIIDYYGTPWFKVKSWFKDMKNKYKDWRYTHDR